MPSLNTLFKLYRRYRWWKPVILEALLRQAGRQTKSEPFLPDKLQNDFEIYNGFLLMSWFRGHGAHWYVTPTWRHYSLSPRMFLSTKHQLFWVNDLQPCTASSVWGLWHHAERAFTHWSRQTYRLQMHSTYGLRQITLNIRRLAWRSLISSCLATELILHLSSPYSWSPPSL